MTMTPAEHYAEAEALIAKYREVDDAVRDPEYVKALQETVGTEAALDLIKGLIPGAALLLQEAQVHATLAAARQFAYRPVVVSAPADLIDRVKIVDPGDSTAGVLFIPDEMNLGCESPESLADKLMEAMKHPIPMEGDR